MTCHGGLFATVLLAIFAIYAAERDAKRRNRWALKSSVASEEPSSFVQVHTQSARLLEPSLEQMINAKKAELLVNSGTTDSMAAAKDASQQLSKSFKELGNDAEDGQGKFALMSAAYDAANGAAKAWAETNGMSAIQKKLGDAVTGERDLVNENDVLTTDAALHKKVSEGNRNVEQGTKLEGGILDLLEKEEAKQQGLADEVKTRNDANGKARVQREGDENLAKTKRQDVTKAVKLQTDSGNKAINDANTNAVV